VTVDVLSVKAPPLSRFNDAIASSFFNSDEAAPSLLSPAQILYQMMIEKKTGKLAVYDPREPGVAWHVFIGNGQVHFATCSVGQFERLRYLRQSVKQASANQSDYEFLCKQWQSGRLTLGQLRDLLVCITQDALVQVLKLSTALISFDPHLGLDPLLMSVPLPQLLTQLRAELILWKQVPEILSPLQRPFVLDRTQLHHLCHTFNPSYRVLMMLPCLERNFCLYQIAQQINVPVLKILPFVRGAIRRGIIEMRPYQTPSVLKPIVTCIDSSQQIQSSVKAGLEPMGYQVLGLTEPQHVWSHLKQHEPAMLLIDVDGFEGYGLMKTLSRAERFQTIPMIALTERQGLVNRFRSRQQGASECLSKPINLQTLCSLTQQLAPLAAG
jgi:twitching motility two-component system response regulator PilG